MSVVRNKTYSIRGIIVMKCKQAADSNRKLWLYMSRGYYYCPRIIHLHDSQISSRNRLMTTIRTTPKAGVESRLASDFFVFSYSAKLTPV